jgi:hypothetical protein
MLAGALLASKGLWLPARILSLIGNSFLMFADDGEARGDEPNICPLAQSYNYLDCILCQQ